MVQVTIQNTFGALQVGSSVSVFLFGIVTLQTHVYFSRFSADRLPFKALVAVLWLLELGHTISIFYEVYRTTILFYGRSTSLLRFPSIGATIILGGIITTAVQGFFSFRVWKLLPKPYNAIGLAVGSVSFMRFIISTYGGIKAIQAPVYLAYTTEPSTERLALSVLIMGAIIDIAIAVSMVYFLSMTRDRSLKKVTRLVDRLIAYSLGTGFLTSVTATVVLIIYRVQPNTMVYLAFYTLLAKLYSNSLLSSLNSRTELRNAISNSSVSLEVVTPRRRGTLSTRPAYANAISIEMKTVTEYKGDNLSV